MHSGRYELTNLTHTRLEDNLIGHRADRHICMYPAAHHQNICSLSYLLRTRYATTTTRLTGTKSYCLGQGTRPNTFLPPKHSTGQFCAVYANGTVSQRLASEKEKQQSDRIFTGRLSLVITYNFFSSSSQLVPCCTGRLFQFGS